jgi:dienelactone hydrolase
MPRGSRGAERSPQLAKERTVGSTLWDHYARVARRISDHALEDVTTLEQWQRQREVRLKQFRTMMGLEPMPKRCDLNPRVFGDFSGGGYRAEKVAFEILPDVHAAANLYHPDPMPAGRLPAVLYVCGHHVIGVQAYQAHGAMWARRGYVCLVLDTIEQHDNRGDHHALFYGVRPDWVSRGYVPAGGELWNSMRAVDFLLSLPEVDPGRVGVTGLSGGGAHSFFLPVADERIRSAAPLCGVDTLKFFIGDWHWLHHCDCMFPYNIFQQDSSDWAALVAPRPLLLGFASEDGLFSPAGYKLLAERTRRIYSLYGAEDACQLFEYPGPHGYKPETIEAVNRWFDRHVAGQDRPAIALPDPVHSEGITTVFNGATPARDHLDLLPELLQPRAGIALPASLEEVTERRAQVKGDLLAGPLSSLARADDRLEVGLPGDFLADERRYLRYHGRIDGMDVRIEILLAENVTGKALVALAEPGQTALDLWSTVVGHSGGHSVVTIEGRGAGYSGYDRSSHSMRAHMLRAGAFVGMTETMLSIRDLTLALEFLRALPELAGQQIYLYGRGDAGVACLYTALLDDAVAGVVADSAPRTHLEGAHIPGILRTLDIPHVIGLLAPRPVGLASFGRVRSFWPERLYTRLGCPDRLAQGDLASAMQRVLQA